MSCVWPRDTVQKGIQCLSEDISKVRPITGFDNSFQWLISLSLKKIGPLFSLIQICLTSPSSHLFSLGSSCWIKDPIFFCCESALSENGCLTPLVGASRLGSAGSPFLPFFFPPALVSWLCLWYLLLYLQFLIFKMS